MEEIKVALCASRHPMPEGVSGSIFPETCGFNFNELAEIAISFIKKNFPPAYEGGIYPASLSSYGDETFWNIDGKLTVYVTGFTPALIALINACRIFGLYDLVLMHYNRETGEYIPQNVVW